MGRFLSLIFGLAVAVALCGAAPTNNPPPNNQREDGAPKIAERPPPAPSIQVVVGPKEDTGCEPTNEDRESDLCAQWKAADAATKAADWSFWSFLVGVGTIGALIITIYQSRRAIRIARDNLTLDHPPVLIVNNVAIWPQGGDKRAKPRLSSGEKISGQAHLFNSGREPATIGRAHLVVAWLKEPLPMIRPYDEGGTGQIWGLTRCGSVGSPQREFEGPKIDAGAWASWHFDADIPPGIRGKQLYVLGAVYWEDRLHTQRAQAFCRRFNAKTQRFEAVTDNPDYETSS